MNEAINISYVDDSNFYLEALQMVFEDKPVEYKAQKYVLNVSNFSTPKLFKNDKSQKPDIILLDIVFNKNKEIGFDLANYAVKKYPNAVIMMYSQLDHSETIKRCMEIGVNNFISKLTPIKELGNKLIECYLLFKNETKINELKSKKTFNEIEILTQKIIESNINCVSVIGEPGSGKSFLGQYLKNNVKKKDKFIIFNCATVPRDIVQAQLFGYVEGAIPGMEGSKKGIIESAKNGWVFIDEIDYLPMESQTVLFQYLDTGLVSSIGSTQPKKVNTKIITATNKDLSEYVEKKLFRKDLYERLSIVPIYLYPLRDCKDAIPDIIELILENIKGGISGYRISSAVIKYLQSYDWRAGNIRELKYCILAMTNVCEDNKLKVSDVPKYIQEAISSGKKISYKELEQDYFVSVVKKVIKNNNLKSMRSIAPFLKLPTSTFTNKLDRLPAKKKQEILNLLEGGPNIG